jgi:hypothetical protein
MKSMLRALDERWKHRDGVATYGMGRHAGALATAVWASARGLLVPPRTEWELSIALDVVDAHVSPWFAETTDTRFHIAIASIEWGFYFCHHSRVSWIRVTDVPFVHERDDFSLLPRTPPLRELGTLVRALEERHRIRFRREHAAIRASLPNAEHAVREWVVGAL